MQKEIIQKEIVETEKKILAISQEVYEIRNIDTIDEWLVTVINSKIELAQSFNLPTDPKIKEALLTLIQNHSLLSKPIINLLAKRISAFTATIGDLYNHKLRSAELKDLKKNFEPLRRLVRKYSQNYEHSKSIKLIAEALETNRLHIYKSRPMESDLRVALRAFYEDSNRKHKEKITQILEFILDRLSKHVKISGFISHPRHSWWAVLTLLSEGNEEWLNKNSTKLDEIINHLIKEVEYSPRIDFDFSTVVPELHSSYNEKTWVTINAIRLFNHGIENYITSTTIKSLKEKIDSNFNMLIGLSMDGLIKNFQSKLILLYDMLGYLNRLESLELSNQKEIVLSKNYIGKFLYDDSVIDQYKNIYPTIQSIIRNRSIWNKHIQSSLMISGSPGQGKSELCKQISKEIKKIADNNNKFYEDHYYVIGTDITSAESLQNKLDKFRHQEKGNDKVQVVVFDEFDKAEFEFYAPFLKFLEEPTNNNQPVTFWIFAQSSFPTFKIFQAHAETLTNKSMRDFATRIKLGTIDLSELKLSPQQKIFTTIGYAIHNNSDIKKISKNCFLYFATNDKFKNNRDIISAYSEKTKLRERKLFLSKNQENDSFIKIKT